MAVVDRPTLKSYFETGDRPTQLEFENLIDSSFNIADDQLAAGWIVQSFQDSIFFGADEHKNGGWMNIPKPLGAKRITEMRVMGESPSATNLASGLWYLSNVAIPGLSSFDIGFGIYMNKVIGQNNTNIYDCHVTPVTGIFDETFSVLQPFELPEFGFFRYWGNLGSLITSFIFPSGAGGTINFSGHIIGLKFD